jgi:hypothetical protein
MIFMPSRPIGEVIGVDNVHDRRIFQGCFAYRRTSAEISEMAKKLLGRVETDVDLFIGLHEDLIRSTRKFIMQSQITGSYRQDNADRHQGGCH